MKDKLKIEAALFASGKHMSVEYISGLANLSVKDTKEFLLELQQDYNEKNTALRIYEEANRWKLNVKEEYASVVKKVVSEAELPNNVMQTLALIAYKSPVLQTMIIEARGQSAYDHISILEDKEFISREREGRTYKINVTDKFYEYFDLQGDGDVRDVMGDITVADPEFEIDEDEDDNEDTFDKKIKDRMKKLERSEDEVKGEDEFLKGLDTRLGNVQKNVDEVITSKEFEEASKKDEDEEKQENS